MYKTLPRHYAIIMCSMIVPLAPSQQSRGILADHVARKPIVSLRRTTKPPPKFRGADSWTGIISNVLEPTPSPNPHGTLGSPGMAWQLCTVVHRMEKHFHESYFMVCVVKTFDMKTVLKWDNIELRGLNNYLSAMSVSRFVKDVVEVSEALGRVYMAITKLGPQVPQSHRGEAQRVEFLRTAVIGYDWAVEPLSRISTHRLSFQQL